MTKNISYVDHVNSDGELLGCKTCGEPLLRECTMQVHKTGLKKISTGYLLCKCGFAFYEFLKGTETSEDETDDKSKD